MKKRYYIIVIFAFVFSSLSAQTITNIKAQQEGRDIVIYYELSDEADVDLTIRFNKKKQKVKMLSGDIGKRVQAGKQNKIVWHVLDEKGSTFLQNNVTFTIRANAPYRTILLAQGGISAIPFTPSGGLMIGGVKRVGWYVKGRSNFQTTKAIEGVLIQEGGWVGITNPLIPAYTGRTRFTEWNVDAGVVVNFLNKQSLSLHKNSMFGVYAGLGYGQYARYWEIADGRWIEYAPTAVRGLSFGGGVIGSIKGLTINAGVSTIMAKYMEIEVGLGWTFNK